MIKPTAIVVGVGAECGLGAALCRRFAYGGYHVLIAGRTAAKVNKVAETIVSAGGSAEPIAMDATHEADVSTGRLGNRRCQSRPQAVGTVPPSMTYSVPVMEAARGEARNAMRSATSLGFAGRPSGYAAEQFIDDLLCAFVIRPGLYRRPSTNRRRPRSRPSRGDADDATPLGLTSLDSALL